MHSSIIFKYVAIVILSLAIESAAWAISKKHLNADVINIIKSETNQTIKEAKGFAQAMQQLQVLKDKVSDHMVALKKTDKNFENKSQTWLELDLYLNSLVYTQKTFLDDCKNLNIVKLSRISNISKDTIIKNESLPETLFLALQINTKICQSLK